MDEWISVNERLPESYKNVLVWYGYFRYGNYNAEYHTYGIAFYVKKRNGWFGDASNCSNFKVEYWMPLPKPPKN
jgi:hypothetical protein